MPKPIIPAALGLLALAAPALAQDRPPLFPTRDVAVTYRAPQAGGEMRMSWLAARGVMRMDMPDGQGWMVVSPGREGGGFIVMPAQRMVMDLPEAQMAEARRLSPGPQARFLREGTDRIAGTPCTIWRVEEGRDTGRVCMTADGVALRAEQPGQPQSRMEATSVAYGPQDPARFERPRGYQSFQLPSGLPGGLPRGTALPPPGLPPRP